MRDNEYNIKVYILDKVDKLHFARDLMQTRINRIPLGGRKYAYARELMKSELENF